jgi:hypothetical protein
VGNALKYVQPGRSARIDITAGPRSPGWVRMEIADRGIGIPDDDKPNIFESFHRAQSAAGYAGTGLGLAICRRIVERHGGAIGVTDNPGGGTRFFFTLPAAEVPAAPEPAAPEPAAPEQTEPERTEPEPAAPDPADVPVADAPATAADEPAWTPQDVLAWALAERAEVYRASVRTPHPPVDPRDVTVRAAVPDAVLPDGSGRGPRP